MNLAEIKAAAEAADKGPWEARCGQRDEDAVWLRAKDGAFIAEGEESTQYANFYFCALSREAVPWLVERCEELAEALHNAQGCRACDHCPDCRHLAHGSAKEIGHFEDCEIAAALARLEGE